MVRHLVGRENVCPPHLFHLSEGACCWTETRALVASSRPWASHTWLPFVGWVLPFDGVKACTWCRRVLCAACFCTSKGSRNHAGAGCCRWLQLSLLASRLLAMLFFAWFVWLPCLCGSKMKQEEHIERHISSCARTLDSPMGVFLSLDPDDTAGSCCGKVRPWSLVSDEDVSSAPLGWLFPLGSLGVCHYFGMGWNFIV